MITVAADTIHINARRYGTQFSIYDRELLQDIFGNYYTGQQIIIKATDGEDLTLLGVVAFIIHLCKAYNIPQDKICFNTHSNTIDQQFELKRNSLTMFWDTQYYSTASTFLPNANAVFVGCTVGRFTPSRLRLIYELEKTFPNDTYLIPHFKDSVENFYKDINMYQFEIEWFNTHTFNIDTNLSLGRSTRTGVEWEKAVSSYHNVSPNFYIEVVPETHVYSNWWFTEKLGKCLFTGKPFLLLAGQHSLKRIRDMGFKTFDSIIDESYDNELTPALRTQSIIRSLKELYNNSDRQILIKRMYEISQHNKLNFKTLSSVVN
jgi:hypothetical protein